MTGLAGAIFHAAASAEPRDRLDRLLEDLDMAAMRAALDHQLPVGEVARVMNTLALLDRRATPPFRDLALARRAVNGLSCTPDPANRRPVEDDRGAGLLTNTDTQTVFVPSRARSSFWRDNARLLVTLAVLAGATLVLTRGIRLALRNRLRHYRHACNVTCEINPGVSGQTGRLLDMSQMGCRLLCARPIAPGRTIQVRVGSLDQTAKVTWARGRNAGLVFEAPVSSDHIGEVLELTQQERRRTRLERLRALYRT